MIVTGKKEKCNFHINIGGHEISQKQCIRYLGVMLDDSLTWKQHIAHTSSKLSNGCWALSQIRKYSKSQMVKKVYVALLYPHIQYCTTSWGSEMITIRFAGWISSRIVSLQPDTNIQNVFFDIFRIQTFGKVAHCTIIQLLSSEASFLPSVP